MPCMLAPGADRLVERIVGARRAELDPVVLPEPGDRRLVQDHLGHRRQFDGLQLLDRPLRRRIEPPRAIQHVAEQVEPHRPRLARRKDVDDAAAHRIVAGFLTVGDWRKAHPHQKRPQCRLVDPVADPRGEGRVAA